jgi:hypothetical protein
MWDERRRRLGARLGFVLGLVAASSMVLSGGQVVRAAPPTLTIPGRVYPTIDTIMDFTGTDPISGDARKIEIDGVAVGPLGCDPDAANGFDIDDCPRVQMSILNTNAGLLRLPDTTKEDSTDPSDPDNIPDTWVNSTGAVVEFSDSDGLDSAGININGTQAQINATLAKLQLVPCTQQQGTFHDCANNGVTQPNEEIFEERETEDGQLPRLDIIVIHGDPANSDTVSGSIYFKVESANTAPYFDEIPLTAIDMAVGDQDVAVAPTVSILDDDMCKADANWCGATYPGSDMAEGDDEMLLLMWIPEPDCGTFSFFGGNVFTNTGSAGGLETVTDVVQAWTGMSLNDPDQPSQLVAANAIAAAVQATLSPEAWALDLTQQMADDTTVFAGTAGIGDVRYTIDNISYSAPTDEKTCHVNIAVSDLGNNGTPIEYVGSPFGPESPFTGQTYDDDNDPGSPEVPFDDEPYEVPDAQATSSSLAFNVADAHPDVTISQIVPSQGGDPAGPNKPSGFRISFSEPVEGFDVSDLTLTNSSASAASFGLFTPVTASEYTVLVTANGDGTITLEMPGVAYAVGHDGDSAFASEAPTYDDNEIEWDGTGPTVTIDKAVGQADPVNVGPIVFTVEFSDTVSTAPIGFDESDVDLSGSTALGSLAATVTQPDLLDLKTYQVSVDGMTGPGTVVATVVAGAIVDTALNPSDASTSTDNSVDFDNSVADVTNPTVTINQAAAQGDPTAATPVVFDVVFSEPVADFATGDVTLGGTALPTTAMVSGSGTTYTVAVSGMTLDGTVTAGIMAGVAQDAAGNLNDASTSTDNSVTFDFDEGDVTAPTVTINQAAAQADPTGTSPIVFEVVFSEPVAGFVTGDVTLGGTAAATTATVSGSGATYMVAVSGMGPAGTVIASIAAGAAVDAANNPNVASTSGDNEVTWAPADVTSPTVTINQAAAQADPTGTSPIVFDVVFSESVADFATGDVTLGGTAGATTATVSGSGTTYTVEVSGMGPAGTVTASVAAGVAHDAANNPNVASTSGDAEVTWAPADVIAPTVTINQAAAQADPTGTSPIVFDVVFSEPVTGFDPADVMLTAPPGANAAVSGSGATYTVSVAGMTEPGLVVASIPAGVAADAAANTNEASTSTDNQVTYAADSESTPGGTVSVTATGGVLTEFDVMDPQVAPPDGVTFPYGQFTFSATTTPGGLVTFQFVLPATVDAYYKLVGGAWEDFTWNGTTGAQINGTLLSVTIQDNGRGDSDPAAGVATDPGAPALVQAVVPSSSTTTTTVPGGGGTTTTTSVPGGSGTTTTLPGGGSTTTTLPGGGSPTTVAPPGPIPGLPATGNSPGATLAWAALAIGLGTILVTVRRRAHR